MVRIVCIGNSYPLEIDKIISKILQNQGSDVDCILGKQLLSMVKRKKVDITIVGDVFDDMYFRKIVSDLKKAGIQTRYINYKDHIDQQSPVAINLALNEIKEAHAVLVNANSSIHIIRYIIDLLSLHEKKIFYYMSEANFLNPNYLGKISHVIMNKNDLEQFFNYRFADDKAIKEFLNKEGVSRFKNCLVQGNENFVSFSNTGFDISKSFNSDYIMGSANILIQIFYALFSQNEQNIVCQNNKRVYSEAS